MTEAKPALIPITVIADPWGHPMVDPKDTEKKVIGVPVAAVPDGYRIESLKRFFEEYRTKPAARSGTVKMASLESFINFVNRYKSHKRTVIFVDQRKFGGTVVTAIINYHPEGPEEKDTGASDFRVVFVMYGISNVPEISRRCAVPIFWGKAP